jgi:hypothetical protein
LAVTMIGFGIIFCLTQASTVIFGNV